MSRPTTKDSGRQTSVRSFFGPSPAVRPLNTPEPAAPPQSSSSPEQVTPSKWRRVKDGAKRFLSVSPQKKRAKQRATTPEKSPLSSSLEATSNLANEAQMATRILHDNLLKIQESLSSTPNIPTEISSSLTEQFDQIDLINTLHEQMVNNLRNMQIDTQEEGATENPEMAGATPKKSVATTSTSVKDEEGATDDIETNIPATPIPAQLFTEEVMVDTYDYVFNTVWALLQNLRNRHPQHPMFGPCEKDKLRAPFNLPGGRGAATSWHKKAVHLAQGIQKTMGKRIPRGACWLSPNEDTSIARKSALGTQEKLITYKTYRWLAFLSDPSAENWLRLTGGLGAKATKGVGTSSPFLHFCHNGFAGKAKGSNGCVNGVQHGRFGTPTENNLQRDCARRDRKGCPGHGNGHPSHCIYVHKASGNPKFCLNEPEGPPATCVHTTKCYG